MLSYTIKKSWSRIFQQNQRIEININNLKNVVKRKNFFQISYTVSINKYTIYKRETYTLPFIRVSFECFTQCKAS